VTTEHTRASQGPPGVERYAQVHEGPEFAELRRSFRNFAFPLTVGFISWYLLYVLLSNYAGGFMGTTVVGNINVAFVLGLLQFLTTFVIAWLYARYADSRLDPKADARREALEVPHQRQSEPTGTLSGPTGTLSGKEGDA
jgi:uncharacterized membrane protein (DUF485 family)